MNKTKCQQDTNFIKLCVCVCTHVCVCAQKEKVQRHTLKIMVITGWGLRIIFYFFSFCFSTFPQFSTKTVPAFCNQKKKFLSRNRSKSAMLSPACSNCHQGPPVRRDAADRVDTKMSTRRPHWTDYGKERSVFLGAGPLHPHPLCRTDPDRPRHWYEHPGVWSWAPLLLPHAGTQPGPHLLLPSPPHWAGELAPPTPTFTVLSHLPTVKTEHSFPGTTSVLGPQLHPSSKKKSLPCYFKSGFRGDKNLCFKMDENINLREGRESLETT